VNYPIHQVNYPPTAEPMGWASDFIDLRFFTEVLFYYRKVNGRLHSTHILMGGFYAPFYKKKQMFLFAVYFIIWKKLEFI